MRSGLAGQSGQTGNAAEPVVDLIASRERTRSALEPSRRHGWGVALVMSLAIHALIGLALARVTPQARTSASDYPQLDVDVVAEGDDPFLTIEDQPRAKRPAVATASFSMEDVVILPLVSVPPDAGPPPPSNSSAPANDRTQEGGANSGMNGGTTSKLLQVTGKGLNVVYLVDCSASMGPSGALTSARRELLAALQRLPAGTRFQILVYNTRPGQLLPNADWLTATSENLAKVFQALEDLQAEGKTDHGSALERGLLLRPDVLFFLTDANDLAPEQLRTASQGNRGRTQIHVVGLNGQDRR